MGTENPDLDPEDLMSYEVSASQHFMGRRLAVEGNLYYIKGENSSVPVA